MVKRKEGSGGDGCVGLAEVLGGGFQGDRIGVETARVKCGGQRCIVEV